MGFGMLVDVLGRIRLLVTLLYEGLPILSGLAFDVEWVPVRLLMAHCS